MVKRPAPAFYAGTMRDRDGNEVEVWTCEDVPKGHRLTVSEETLRKMSKEIMKREQADELRDEVSGYGKPAFPLYVRLPDGSGMIQQGMSLRDWFAGQALVGQLAHVDAVGSYAEMAEHAYSYAAAMMEAREKNADG